MALLTLSGGLLPFDPATEIGGYGRYQRCSSRTTKPRRQSLRVQEADVRGDQDTASFDHSEIEASPCNGGDVRRDRRPLNVRDCASCVGPCSTPRSP